MAAVTTCRALTVLESDIVDVSTAITLDMSAYFRSYTPHVFIGAQFFSDSGGASTVVPSGGSIAYNCKPITTNQYEPFNPATVNADTPETASVAAPPLNSVQATPSAIAGAAYWKITVVSYTQ
jgi:hypothetical protein